MKKIIVTVFIFVLLLTDLVRAEELLGKCVGVADGDTCTILLAGNETRRIRFYGIDAPESGQDFGKKAKEYFLQAAEKGSDGGMLHAGIVAFDEQDEKNRKEAKVWFEKAQSSSQQTSCRDL